MAYKVDNTAEPINSFKLPMTGVVGKFGGAGKWMSRNLYAILYGAITKPNNR